MKKLLAVLLTLEMVLMSLAFCEASGEEWICPNCGKTNTTNFCTSCGTKRDVWICPSCGTENSDAFCGNCGSPKPIDARPETPAGGELTTEGTGSIKVGDIVTFGRYPQTAEGTDQTPIEWIVLDYDEKENKALLLSKYGLDVKPYNTEWTGITWEKCTLRTWLNGEFLNKAFSAGEQSAILMTADIGGTIQKMLAEQYGPEGLKSDILKAPHHGKNAVNGELLRTVDPKLTIITGKVARTEDCRIQMETNGIEWKRTSYGTIVMETDGKDWYVNQEDKFGELEKLRKKRK